MLTSILTAVHLIAAIGIVVLVLLQQGKGADMGAAFGGGSSQSVFGSRGSANFLSRTTAILAVVFFLTGLTLAYIYASQSSFQSVTQGVESEQPVERAGDLPEVPDDGTDTGSSEGAAQGSEGGSVPAVPESNGTSDSSGSQ